jgi:hypothetical protein
MAVVEVHPEPIEGPWVEGFVLNRHVISSRPIGYVGEHLQFETARSPLGEVVLSAEVPKRTTERHRRNSRCLRQRAVERPHRLRCSTAAIAAPDKAAGGADRCRRGDESRRTVPRDGAGQGYGDAADKERTVHERGPLLSEAIEAGTEAVQGGGFC